MKSFSLSICNLSEYKKFFFSLYTFLTKKDKENDLSENNNNGMLCFFLIQQLTHLRKAFNLWRRRFWKHKLVSWGWGKVRNYYIDEVLFLYFFLHGTSKASHQPLNFHFLFLINARGISWKYFIKKFFKKKLPPFKYLKQND